MLVCELSHLVECIKRESSAEALEVILLFIDTSQFCHLKKNLFDYSFDCDLWILTAQSLASVQASKFLIAKAL